MKDRNRNFRSNAASGELDQLLSAHLRKTEELTPSSGFLSSVMERVQAETAAPPPIAFPWRRVAPGMIVVACTMAAFSALAVRLWRRAIIGNRSPAGTVTTAIYTAVPSIHLTSLEQGVAWAALASILSLAIAACSIRLVRGRA